MAANLARARRELSYWVGDRVHHRFLFALAGIREWTFLASSIVGLIGGVFYGSPQVVRMMLKKRFSGFRLQLVRDEGH